MKLLITGGTGYLGSKLVQLALAQGWPVSATYFSQTPPEAPAGVAWLRLDVRDQAATQTAFEVAQPDVAVHTAFMQRGPELWATTAEGSRHVAQAAQAIGARLIHMSSDVIFDGERDGPYHEADPPGPISDYGEAKAAAEAFVQAHHPAAAIVRTSLIYGFAPLDMHTRFVLALADGQQEAKLFTDEYRCPVCVDDLAAALLELAQHDFAGIINIAGSDVVSRYEFGTLLASYHGRNPERLQSGISSDYQPRRPRNCTLDIRLAQGLLHTPLRGVRSVLQQ
jgi:dTDP-4-dehydrorhamnose reductase